MKREPRLQFSDADLAEPKLEKPIKRVKKAEAKADKAQAKIPKKTVVKKERGFDPATGKVKTQLRFEEVDKKKPPSKLTHAVQDAPASFVLSQVHREVRQSEDDNVGVEAAHKVEQAVESGGRLVQSAHRAHQLKPYRAAIRAEKKLEQANLDALQKKAEIDSPTSNPVSKWQQKQAIKKQYAAAKHNQAAQTTAKAAENTAKAAKKAAEKAEKAGKYVWEHRRGFAIAAAILLMPAFHNRLHQELLEELYPTLAATVAPSPYQITQEDIDNALLDWHNNLKGKQEVALYMQAHGRERSTAAWLAAKYGWEDSKTPMYIHVGNAEPVTLTWAQVQRRLAQLIRENKFYDENQKAVCR